MTDRKKGIGGTDISAIVGMNPHKSRFDVWLDKTGQAVPKEVTEPMYWGKAMEPLLDARYQKETGLIPEIVEPLALPDKPWHVGSPDRIVRTQGVKVLELKTAGLHQSFLWGDPGTDEVPKPYYLQTLWYMPLVGATEGEIAALIGNTKFAIYKITLDIELLGFLQEEAERFWVDHVLANKPPEISATEGAKAWLRKMYPQDQGAMLEPTDEEILMLIQAYRGSKANLKNYEELTEQYENRLKAIIGSNAGMIGGWGKITWKKAKDSLATDWKAIFEEWANLDPTLSAIIKEKHTTIKPGSRRFLAKFRED